MMIPPTTVFTELLHSSESAIRSAIRGFKMKIRKLKKAIEDPGEEDFICPSYDLQLEMNREYLECAITALMVSGFEYIPSKSEERSLAFNEKLFGLRRLDFFFGGYFQGYDRYVITFGEGENAEIVHTRGLGDELPIGRESIDKQGCIRALRGLYMGEWKTRYFTKALDGVEWELGLEFSCGEKKVFRGSNAFPFSYGNLVRLCNELCPEDSFDEMY